MMDEDVEQIEVNVVDLPTEDMATGDMSKKPGFGNVSTLYRCQTKDASQLCLYNISHKLENNGKHDIGGTYIGDMPDFWFFFTTSACFANNYLLNLFVCHRRTDHYSIGISNSKDLCDTTSTLIDSKITNLTKNLSWHTFRTARKDEKNHIKTYCFNAADVKKLQDCTLYIFLKIRIDTKVTLNTEVVKTIKLQHDLSNLLSKQEKSDFHLESSSGKKFPAHKIILAAHSPILMNLIKETTTDSLFIDISDNELELLLEFIYTGTVSDILKQDCLKILEIADKFQLKQLFILMQYVIEKQIAVENAMDLAKLAKKYNLDKLKHTVFKFIKKNPVVMNTKGWADVTDIDLVKSIFHYIHSTEPQALIHTP